MVQSQKKMTSHTHISGQFFSYRQVYFLCLGSSFLSMISPFSSTLWSPASRRPQGWDEDEEAMHALRLWPVGTGVIVGAI